MDRQRNGRRGSPAREAGGSSEPDGGVPPVPRRNYVLAILVALLVFAILVVGRVLWSDLGGSRTAPELPPVETPAAQPAG